MICVYCRTYSRPGTPPGLRCHADGCPAAAREQEIQRMLDRWAEDVEAGPAPRRQIPLTSRIWREIRRLIRRA